MHFAAVPSLALPADRVRGGGGEGREALSGTDLCAGHALCYKWVSRKWLRGSEMLRPQLLLSALCSERGGVSACSSLLAEGPGASLEPEGVSLGMDVLIAVLSQGA